MTLFKKEKPSFFPLVWSIFFQLLVKLSFLGKAVNILICATCPVFYDYVVTIRLHYPAKNEMLVYQMRLLPYESSVVKT